MATLYLAYAVSLIAILLGFLALLKQKTYIDAATNQPTEIELPLLGKMKSNYPALAFLFLGIGLAIAAFEKSYPPRKVQWTIQGAFLDPIGGSRDFRAGTLVVRPADVDVEVSNLGKFRITASIDEGRRFDEAFDLIDYSDSTGSAQIFPKDEYTKYVRRDSTTLIQASAQMTLQFKPKPLATFTQGPH